MKTVLDASTEYVTCGYADLNGNLRGHLVSRRRFEVGLETGLALVPEAVVLGPNDEIFLPDGYLSMDLSFADQKASIVRDGSRRLPDYPAGKDGFFFLEFAPESDGRLWAPRQVYGRAVERLAALGLAPVAGCEYEFRVYAETPSTVVAKGFKNLDTLVARSGYMNVVRQSEAVDFLSGLLDMCGVLDIGVTSIHWEHGAGMLEVALDPQRGVRAADDALLFKEFSKVFALRNRCVASYMAKPVAEEDGAANHVHLSLLRRNGRNAFYDAKAPHGMSTIQRHFVGGIQKLLPELMLMVAPNPNSWRRFVPDAFAPLAATWGIENRTTAVRVIPGSDKSQRLEFRVAGADTNPYLVQACLLGMGAWGVEHEIEPLKPIERSAYMRQARLPKAVRFPQSFREAIATFRTSKAALELFGRDFVEIFAGTRQAQLDDLADKRGRTTPLAERRTFLLGI